MLFQDFQAATMGQSWILEWTTLAILDLHVTLMPPTKVRVNPTLQFRSRHGLKIFKMATMGAILDIRMEWF